jgi:hypothetical protein
MRRVGGGWFMGFLETRASFDMYLWIHEGAKRSMMGNLPVRNIIVVFERDELWGDSLDLAVPVGQMEALYQMNNFFEVSVIIIASYKDVDMWVKCWDVEIASMTHSQSDRTDLDWDKITWIPKEMFNLLLKQEKKDVD